ncbi:zinc ribbon domain-containing protein [Haloterrigena salinisoli]|uniref:zinc ribbon domain-containing protein n=1 Tax=Haloterrigena salinisoli TaxID=3132747 RepID=UPI0030CC1DF2
MGRSISQKRPWIAALLAVFLTGFGHLYLRRWRRALGWLAASFVVSALLVDSAAVEELMAGSGSPETMLAVSPMLCVVGLSAIDAYLLARAQNATDRSPTGDTSTAVSAESTDGDTIACPHCGSDLDPELEFCHWCTKAVDVDGDRLEDSPDR